MENQKLRELMNKIESVAKLDAETAATALKSLGSLLPVAGLADRQPGFLEETDGVLDLVNEALPGWSVSIAGRSRDRSGAWTCTLRRSLASDDDDYIGVGKSSKLSYAILVALIEASMRLPAA